MGGLNSEVMYLTISISFASSNYMQYLSLFIKAAPWKTHLLAV